MDNKKRKESIVASVLKRNEGNKDNSLDRTLETYKIDKTELDNSFRLSEFEDAIANKVAKELHKYNLDDIKSGGKGEGFENIYETDEVTKFYTDELKNLIGDIGGMSRKMLKNQTARMGALMETLAESNIDKDGFLLDQYAESVAFLEDEYKRKSNVMMRTQTFMGNLASEYLDVQSLYSGFVDHNPLAMGLFKLGKDALDGHREAKMERKHLVENDLHRQVQAEDNEQRKFIFLKEEEARAKELNEATKKANKNKGTKDVTDDNNENSDKSVLRKDSNIPNNVVENKIPDKVSESENEGVKADQIRDENLKKKQYKLLKASSKETSKWQKAVLKKISKLQGSSSFTRGKKGMGLGGMKGKAGSLLSGLGSTVKTMGAGLIGGMGAGIVGAGGIATAATVGVGAAIGTAIGTGITKGYENIIRDGEGSIGTDMYDLLNDNATIQNLEKRKIIDRDWLGNSELDKSKLGELHADELKALLELKDFDKADTQAIMKALKKKTDERLNKINDRHKIKRNSTIETVQAMSSKERIETYGSDPLQIQADNKGRVGRSGKQDVLETIKNNAPANMTDASKPTLRVGEVGGASSPQTKAFMEQLAIGEGTGGQNGYDAMYGYNRFKNNNPTEDKISNIIGKRKPLAEMTIDEVGEYQTKYSAAMKKMNGGRGDTSHATGKYQFMKPTMFETANALGLDTSTTKFTPEIQDAMGEKLAMQSGLGTYMKSDKTGADKFKLQNGMANRWASVVDPRTGKSKYGFNGNAQHGGNDAKSLSGVMNDLANPTKPRTDIAKNLTIPVQNNGVEKVKHIEATDDKIKQSKETSDNPIVVNQQSNNKQASTGSGGDKDSPVVASARNSDSTLQRIGDRTISSSMV